MAVGRGLVVPSPVAIVVGPTGVPSSPVALDYESPGTDIGINGGRRLHVTHRHLTGVLGEERMVEEPVEEAL